jgi:hypothetical protein
MQQLIGTMPTMFGDQFYPYGLPAPYADIHFNGVSLREIFIRYANGNKGTRKDDEIILSDYIRYYLLAPCFIVPEEAREKLSEMNYDELLDFCFDIGVDPF